MCVPPTAGPNSWIISARPIAVRVAQRPNLTVKPLGINVAVRRDRQSAEIFLAPADPFAGDKIIGINQGPETGRKGDAAVIGVGRGQSTKNGCCENAEASGDYGDCSHF